MTDACRELEVLVSLAAAGALEGAEAARLEAHLEACPSCRAERDRLAGLLSLAKLPPPEPTESAALSDLSSSMIRELRRRERRGLVFRRALTGGAVAAGVALALLAPALLRSRGPSLQPAQQVASAQLASAATPAWEEPDLTTLWDESAVLDYGSSGSDGGGTITDVSYTVSDAW